MNKKPYIALGVTYKCNFNCIYCNPIGGQLSDNTNVYIANWSGSLFWN